MAELTAGYKDKQPVVSTTGSRASYPFLPDNLLSRDASLQVN